MFIPSQIKYIFSAPYDTTRYFDDLNEGEVETVLPAFPADAGNPRSIETGTEWATRRHRHHVWNPERRLWQGTTTYEVESYLSDNSPIQNVQLCSLEKRSEGGRAYKVIIPIGNRQFWVDLREDILLDTCRHSTVTNGLFDCEFIWARVGSEMKLVRIGSGLHNELIQNTEDRQLKNIPKRGLEIGGIYRTKGKDQVVYFGEVKGFTLANSGNTGYYRSYVTYELQLIPKLQLWIPFSEDRKFSSANYLRPNLVQDKKVTKHLGNISNYEPNIDIFSELQRVYRFYYDYSIDELTRLSYRQEGSRYRDHLRSLLSYYSQFFIVPLNQRLEIPPIYKEYFPELNWSEIEGR